MWSWALSSLLAAVLLYVSVRHVDWGRVWQTIGAAQWRYLAAATAFIAFSYFVRAVRWRILLNAEAWFSMATVFWANMAGYLGNNFLPARAGELIRSYLISNRSSLSKTYVLTTALSERLMDVIALVLWSSLVLLGLDPKPRWIQDLSGTMAIVAGLGALAIVVLPHTGSLVENLLGRVPLPEHWRNRLLGLAGQVLSGLRAFHDWGRFTGFTVLTVVIWVSDACGVLAGARALGLTISFRVALLLLTGLGLGSALPSTPGYVGIYQFVAVTVLTPFGVSRDEALAYILVAQAMASVVLVVFGLPGLYRLRAAQPVAAGTA
ncbi:MAG TPA: lysylphosphatidylglycerol synthase transmembrane domain-containing protein [Bryobacteraceae bacterium]|nr:lysylphosphatidylglycerol synthase transmembrane domain-containing protein [Bryobacteraceae bacterium]